MNVSVFSAKLIIAISSGHTIQKNYPEIKFTYDFPRLVHVDVQIIDLKIQWASELHLAETDVISNILHIDFSSLVMHQA